ncbi:calcium-binding protein [Aromatoleum anaerobium]|uniref:calcium-binding protein n=1 Tax=Aromatoleum anaerobium TaxID=182180 RepID=UPI001FF36506|nr:calcium-binding protein [Aromatoleum anaerobium]MCK0505532.1 calcium-binding protein [Aromatoleum anaerobium]
MLNGLAGNDTLNGEAGVDTLDGGAGTDILKGGLGDDIYLIDLTAAGALQDTVTEALNAGTDTIRLRGSSTNTTTVTLTLGANIEHLDASNTGGSRLNLSGNALNNTLTGNAAANVLNGGPGADTLAGGAGNDTYVIDNAGDAVSEALDAGTDLVQVGIALAGGTYSLADNVENAALSSLVAFSVTGNALDNVLTGNAAVNTLAGGDGNDTLNGGAGIDTLTGGAGNDTYVIDNAGDGVSEALDAGTDLVQVGVATAGGTYRLADNVENATLTSLVAFNLTGNALDNTLTGNAAANILNGGAGADTMVGGAGNDTYIIDHGDDVVHEALNAGLDLVQVGIASTGGQFILAENVENATLISAVAYDLQGNGLNNTLNGNAAANRLDGGAGTDILQGGLGDDTYLVDLTAAGALQDTVTEALNAGTDTIRLRGSSTNTTMATLTLGANLEHLDAGDTGGSRLNLSGNALNNTLTGNAAANVLDGKGGTDSLNGGEGSDVYLIALATEHPAAEIADSGTTGSDEVRFAASTASTLTLYAGDSGIERVVVGTGSGATAVTLGTAALNVNAAAVMNALAMTGNAGANTLTGSAFNDTLDGGVGADRLIGGDGSDTYVVDNVADAVVETNATAALGGTDVVQVKIATAGGTYTLGANVENATLLNTTAYKLTGNALDNILIANGSANTLNGGAGNDILTGGAGLDIFRFDTTLNAASNLDTITDFRVVDDTIQLENALFTSLTATGALAAGLFRMGDGITTAADANDYLIYNSATGALYYDADGTGSISALQFATLTPGLALGAGDFMVS